LAEPINKIKKLNYLTLKRRVKTLNSLLQRLNERDLKISMRKNRKKIYFATVMQ
jgi:ppGpp synthetase/RelA/SpoT-type nucleotidyltranferase